MARARGAGWRFGAFAAVIRGPNVGLMTPFPKFGEQAVFKRYARERMSRTSHPVLTTHLEEQKFG